MSRVLSSPLFWIDLEMTDLDPDKGKIVEIASVITDNGLKVIDIGPRFVIHQSEATLKNMNMWCQEHFTDSGLLDEIKNSTVSLKEAEEETLKFLKKHALPQAALLAGNSVHVDREFLRLQMPSISNYLHYRIIDVSTIKELARRWYPTAPGFIKTEPHRALDDIYESISELKYYRQTFFKKT